MGPEQDIEKILGALKEKCTMLSFGDREVSFFYEKVLASYADIWEEKESGNIYFPLAALEQLAKEARLILSDPAKTYLVARYEYNNYETGGGEDPTYHPYKKEAYLRMGLYLEGIKPTFTITNYDDEEKMLREIVDLLTDEDERLPTLSVQRNTNEVIYKTFFEKPNGKYGVGQLCFTGSELDRLLRMAVRLPNNEARLEIEGHRQEYGSDQKTRANLLLDFHKSFGKHVLRVTQIEHP